MCDIVVQCICVYMCAHVPVPVLVVTRFPWSANRDFFFCKLNYN